MGGSLKRGRAFRRFPVGTHVVANRSIEYGDLDLRVEPGDKGVVVAPELVQPIVRVLWDDHPARSFTTNVAALDIGPTPWIGLRVRERDRAKASGEAVCRVCGCSDQDACPGGCRWVMPDLCSQCSPSEAGVP
jgi:hypothetical protein